MSSDSSFTAVAVVSLPFDLGGNPGSSLGAERVARVFEQRFGHLERDPASARWADWAGRAGVRRHPYGLDDTWSRWAERVERDTAELVRTGVLPVLVGGNHAALAPAYAAVFDAHPGLRVVSLDAHFDRELDPDGPRERSHANFWDWAVPRDLAAAVCWAGVRPASPPPRESVTYVTSLGWARLTPEEVVARLGVAGRPIVIDLDLDVIDASAFPATVSRAAGGPSWCEVACLVEVLARSCNVCAVGFSEYNPLLDDPLTTSLSATVDLVSTTCAAVLRETGGGLGATSPAGRPSEG